MRKKELSNLRDSPDRGFGLPKSHIIRGRRNFEELFAGSSLITSTHVNLRYVINPKADNNILVGFIAPKKIGKAAQRTHTKRLLREAYRLNQHIITELPEIAEIGLHYAFVAKHANLTFEDVQQDIVKLMGQLHERLISQPSPF